jgi:hypothetical protein
MDTNDDWKLNRHGICIHFNAAVYLAADGETQALLD